MVTSAERRRLEAAYPTPVDAKPVLRECVVGLLTVLVIAVAALVDGGSASPLIADVSVQQGASGR